MKLLMRSLNHCKKSLGSIPNSYSGLQYTNEVSDVLPDEQNVSDSITSKSKNKKGKVWPRRIITGIQPTGALHVGNYFAAVKRCVDLQEKGEDLMVFIADLHSLTSQQDGPVLSERVLQTTALLLASGLQPARCTLWPQSAVPRHAELCWVLACLASHARLAHLPQYKERIANGGEAAGGAGAGAGVLLYPVLQAADVLLYRGTHVPAGADQRQHVQLAALLAATANYRFRRELFPQPVPLLPEDGSDRILSLRDPAKKMSKSDPTPKSRIMLTDSDEQIHLKIRRAVTDFTPNVTFDPASRPGVSNLVRLHCLSSGLLPEEALQEAEHLSTAQYKQVVSAAVCAALRPVRSRAADLARRPAVLRDVLRGGAAAARARADAVWADLADAAGLTATVLPAPSIIQQQRLSYTLNTDPTDSFRAILEKTT